LNLIAVTDWSEEGLQMTEQIVFSDARVPVQEEQKLSLHKVYLWEGEGKAFIALDGSVASPMLILWAGVIEVLRRQYERCEKDAMNGTTHALGDRRKTGLQPSQVD
jgi:hypothetical protein